MFIKLLDVVMVMVSSLNVVHFYMKEKEEERGKVVKICDNNNITKQSCLVVCGWRELFYYYTAPVVLCLSVSTFSDD